NTYTITFDKEEGTGGSDTDTATYDAAMPTATAPARTGYTFIGYFTAAEGTGTKYYNADMSSAKAWDIASDTTLYAAWELIDYTITYNNLNDGTNHSSNPATYTIENPTFSLEAPNRTGYDFSGWYATEEYTGDAITQILTGSHGNETFWAKWTPIVYDITYHLNDGTIDPPNPATYTIETATFEFNDPMRDYYDFVGWYANAELTGDPVGGLDKGSFGNVELWAKWTPTVYTITYHLDGGVNAGENPATYTIESTKITFADPTKS
ncbi:MAG: InlB B-repeat-containing protein, partial [Spirochaetales bacterium]|nr:InlB B-repeat-containing protein [Spirochaetales bacterium]